MSSRSWIYWPGFVVALAFGFSIGNGFNAITRKPADTQTEMMERYGRGDGKVLASLEAWLKLMPASERDAWLKYFRDASRIDGEANESIERANWSTTEQPCFSDLAARFYGEILKEDQRRFVAKLKSGRKSPLGGRYRISLNEQAGNGEWADVAPGSLWKKALEISGGSPNLAMALIGLCGHDDAISFKPKLRPGRAATGDYSEIKRQFIAEISPLFSEGEWFSFLQNELMGEKDGTGLLCLSDSVLLLPGALGADTDLRPEFKREIIQKQSPNLGGSYLPAKYYHVIAGAMRTCELKAHAYTSFFSIVSNPLLAKLYRAYVLTQTIANPTAAAINTTGFDSVAKMETTQLEDISDEDIQALFSRYASMSDKQRSKFFIDPKNWLAVLSPLSLTEKNLVRARKGIEAAYSKRDAALIAQRDFYKFSLPILGEIYLPPRRRTPRQDCAGFGWSQKRCQRALARLESWEVDFDWTASQHYLGALFAFRNCRKLSQAETLETLACRAAGRP
jgi:hypothetical protein